MRRFHVRPYGVSIRPTRALSLLFAVAVLWLLFGRLKDPATWRTLLDLKDDSASTPLLAPEADSKLEEIVAGPNDRDDVESQRARDLCQLVTDRTPLKPREMHAYWKLMTWSRTEPFADLQARALNDVAFTQLWEQPDRYRGKLITLRLHVRRVLKYDSPPNPQNLPFTYEAWGWTDESRSYPYVVVFPECPPGLPVGTDIRGEVVFVGYFLKVMSYTAFDTARGAPLLVGRVQAIPVHTLPAPSRPDPLWMIIVVLGATIIIGLGVWFQLRSRRSVQLHSTNTTQLPDSIDIGMPSNETQRDSPSISVLKTDAEKSASLTDATRMDRPANLA